MAHALHQAFKTCSKVHIIVASAGLGPHMVRLRLITDEWHSRTKCHEHVVITSHNVDSCHGLVTLRGIADTTCLVGPVTHLEVVDQIEGCLEIGDGVSEWLDSLPQCLANKHWHQDGYTQFDKQVYAVHFCIGCTA